jgi:hypothetical protein
MKNFKVVFCDSKLALAEAYQKGLPKSALVKSSSPAVLWDEEINSANFHERWTREELSKFNLDLEKLIKSCHELLSQRSALKKYATSLSSGVLYISRFIYKAACVNEEDLKGEILFLSYGDLKGGAKEVLNPPIEELLSSNTKFKTLICNFKVSSDLGLNETPLIRRLWLGGLLTAIYRCGLKVCRVFPGLWANRRVLIYKENELLIETAAFLFLNGYSIRKLKVGTRNTGKLEKNDTVFWEDVWPLLCSQIRLFVEKWVIAELVEVCVQKAYMELREVFKEYNCSERVWNLEFSQGKMNGVKMVLTNMPNSPESRSLASILSSLKIPFVGFQHGVSREISKNHKLVSINYESNVVDKFLCFNESSVEVSRDIPLCKAQVFSVGTPKRFLRAKSLAFLRRKRDLVYVSTNLYKGNTGIAVDANNDFLLSVNEKDIVKNLLSRLNKQVDYKPYLMENRRYPDKDPVIDYAAKFENINVLKQAVDMRYLLNDYRIIITSEASSTLSWPILADRPVVFINQPTGNPLIPGIEKDFRKGIFVFNLDDESDRKEFRDLLNLSIKEIMCKWKHKRRDREELVKKYFSSNRKSAASHAARYLTR